MQRYFAIKRIDNYFYLKDTDLHHIKNVMRMNNNDIIECVYEEKVYKCSVELNNNKFLIIEELNTDNELSYDITIAIGLVREQKFDLILQKLTELGIKKIIPLQMERSIIKLDNKKQEHKLERWKNICKEASEQSKRNIIPEVTKVMSLKELENNYDYKFVCSTNNQENLISGYLQNTSKYAKMIFVIGPEGGITEEEEKLLNNNGFISVSFGSLVLRVETAAIYVASILNYCSKG